MTLQYSSLSNPPSVLNVPPGGTYTNSLSGADTNSLNIPTSQIQSVSGPATYHGGRRTRRRSSRRRHTKRHGGARRRRNSRRQKRA